MAEPEFRPPCLRPGHFLSATVPPEQDMKGALELNLSPWLLKGELMHNKAEAQTRSDAKCKLGILGFIWQTMVSHSNIKKSPGRVLSG